MSRHSVYLLEKVKGEYDSVRFSVAFTTRFWHQQERLSAAEAVALTQIKETTLQQFIASVPEGAVEEIFIIRLFAVFEGILKAYHSQFHTNDSAPEYASVSWYIDRVAFFNRGRVSERLTANVHEVRKYRNSLTHSLPNIPPVSFRIALADLSKFAIKLPEV